MTKILREPLLHFLLLGAGLFLAHQSLSGRDGAVEPDRIVVGPGRIEQMAGTFARTWLRPPSEQELADLVRDDVREEVYYREALALGLDRDDLVIRRRMRQKLEFLTADVAALVEPTDAQLEAYLLAHADTFRMPALVDLRHVYLSPQRHQERLAEEAARLLAQLNTAGSEADPRELGDQFLLEREFSAVPVTELGKQFGDGFAERVNELTPGRWQGPIESGFGVHLVIVDGRTEGRLPELVDVRDSLRTEWANRERRAANDRYYSALLEKYMVTVEMPTAAGAGVDPAAGAER